MFFIDFGDINDKAEQVYAQLSKNCNKIINFLESSFNISNNICELKGLICLESPYHFVGYLINLEKDIYDLKKNLITYMNIALYKLMIIKKIYYRISPM